MKDHPAVGLSSQALTDSEERFRLLVDAVVDYAIYMLDPGGNVASWNSGAQRIKGYSAQEIIGQHFSKFYRPEDVVRERDEITGDQLRARGSVSRPHAPGLSGYPQAREGRRGPLHGSLHTASSVAPLLSETGPAGHHFPRRRARSHRLVPSRACPRLDVALDFRMFQGRRAESAEKNRTVAFDASALSALVLSHAHIDHSGRLPLLARTGSRNRSTLRRRHTICARSCSPIGAHPGKGRRFLARRKRPAAPPLYTMRDVDRDHRPHDRRRI